MSERSSRDVIHFSLIDSFIHSVLFSESLFMRLFVLTHSSSPHQLSAAARSTVTCVDGNTFNAEHASSASCSMGRFLKCARVAPH